MTSYTRCLRCGRSLRDHVSQGRGYGPECWNKVKHALPPSGAPLTERRSISNIFLVNEVFWDLEKRISSHSCPSCGAHLAGSKLNSYDHEDGLNLRGFLRPQWVYVTCEGCGRDLSLYKLSRDPCGDLCKHSEQRTLAELLQI